MTNNSIGLAKGLPVFFNRALWKCLAGFVCTILCSSFFLVDPVWGVPSLPPLDPSDHRQETLAMRRILGFWRDGEHSFAASSIHMFLQHYPTSLYSDYLWAMLGEIALANQCYEEAQQYFAHITNPDFLPYLQLKKWESLYKQDLFDALYHDMERLGYEHLRLLDQDEALFYYAEARLRRAQQLETDMGDKVDVLMIQTLCQQAQPIFELLSQNIDFKYYAKLGLIEIYRLLECPQQALALYEEIAASTDSPPDILFQAALSYAEYDRVRGGALLKQVIQAPGSYSALAAYHWFIVLVTQQDWATLQHDRTLLLKSLAVEHLPLAHFYLGMLDFENKEFHSCIEQLELCVGSGLSQQYEKKALLTLIQSCSLAMEWQQGAYYYAHLCHRFPDLRSEATYWMALGYEKAGQREEASLLLDRILLEEKDSSVKEKAYVKKIALCIEAHDHEGAHALLTAFFRSYPHSEWKDALMRWAIQLSLNQIQGGQGYEKLAVDVERGVQNGIFEGDELREHEELLAQTYLKLGKNKEALAILKQSEQPDPLLLTQCYLALGDSSDSVIEWGEKALAMYPEQIVIHLHLFNAYRHAASSIEKNSTMHATWTRQAADHLFAVHKQLPLSSENLIWLAHYFAHERIDQAIEILEFLAADQAIDFFHLDREVLLLASLYQEKRRYDSALEILNRFNKQPGKNREAVQLKLADITLAMGQSGVAEKLYCQLEDSCVQEIALRARLERARIIYPTEPEKSLKMLQELFLQKSLKTEPIHLEAALDWAELQVGSHPLSVQCSELLKLFLQLRASFTSQSDLSSQDYHAARALYPEKENIYQAYIRYLDARIYLLQAHLLPEEDRYAKIKAARALFSTLRQGKYSVTTYIQTHAAAGLYE